MRPARIRAHTLNRASPQVAHVPVLSCKCIRSDWPAATAIAACETVVGNAYPISGGTLIGRIISENRPAYHRGFCRDGASSDSLLRSTHAQPRQEKQTIAPIIIEIFKHSPRTQIPIDSRRLVIRISQKSRFVRSLTKENKTLQSVLSSDASDLSQDFRETDALWDWTDISGNYWCGNIAPKSFAGNRKVSCATVMDMFKDVPLHTWSLTSL